MEVHEEADVRLVDAHAEGDRGDHDPHLALHEVILRLGALVGRQARVVETRRDALAAEHPRHRSHFSRDPAYTSPAPSISLQMSSTAHSFSSSPCTLRQDRNRLSRYVGRTSRETRQPLSPLDVVRDVRWPWR